MKFYEGSVVTVDALVSVVRFLGADGGCISYVGNGLPAGCVAASVRRLGCRAAKTH